MEDITQQLREAHAANKAGHKDRKRQIILSLLAMKPKEFFVDTDEGGHAVGLTHRPSKFRFHLPRRDVPNAIFFNPSVYDDQPDAAGPVSGLGRKVLQDVPGTDRVSQQQGPDLGSDNADVVFSKTASHAVDLDGTLAEHNDEAFDPNVIGAPVPAMLKRVRDWIADGEEVVIFTARASKQENIPPVKAWLKEHGIGECRVTNEKSPEMEDFYDDRAYRVEKNTGEIKSADTRTELRTKIKATENDANWDPTTAQAEAGNYAKGHVRLHGLDITIENPKGSTRRGTDANGKEWSCRMHHSYGYIKRTSGRDGEHIDVFIGKHPDSEVVFVVDQIRPDSGRFDEHKCIIGAVSKAEAKATYLANYSPDWKGLGDITALTIAQFRRWLAQGDTTKPMAGQSLATFVKKAVFTDHAEAWHPSEKRFRLVDVQRLIKLVEGRQAQEMPIKQIWGGSADSPGFSEERVEQADTQYPILVDDYYEGDGYSAGLVDGRHRKIKMQRAGQQNANVVRLTPEDIEAATIENNKSAFSQWDCECGEQRTNLTINDGKVITIRGAGACLSCGRTAGYNGEPEKFTDAEIQQMREYQASREKSASAEPHDVGNKLDRLIARRNPFPRPENYDRESTYSNQHMDVGVGANDWECGLRYVGIHRPGQLEREPEVWFEISHAKCPYCKGDEPATEDRDKCCAWARAVLRSLMKDAAMKRAMREGEWAELVPDEWSEHIARKQLYKDASAFARGKEGVLYDVPDQPDEVLKEFIKTRGAELKKRIAIMAKYPELFPKIHNQDGNRVTMERLYDIDSERIPPARVLRHGSAEDLQSYPEAQDFLRRINQRRESQLGASSLTQHDQNVLDQLEPGFVAKDFRLRNNRTAHNIMARQDGSWVINDPIVWEKAAEFHNAMPGIKSAAAEPAIPTTGPEAIMHRLSRLNLEELKAEQMAMIKSGKVSKRGRAVKLMNILEGMTRNKITPEQMMIKHVPVIPAIFRPFAVAGDTFIPGDANELYRDLFTVRELLKESETELGAEGAGEARLALYRATKALFGYGDPVNPKTAGRGVTGFFQKITGTNPKYSWMQRKMLSKPQDNVSRGTITINPDLGLDEIGMPEEMAWKGYAPWIQRRLVRQGYSPGEAVMAIRDRNERAMDALKREIVDRPVVYSRAPAWHKFNTIAGKVKLTQGNTIEINPFVTTGHNADFDGDQMNVHVPASEDAVKEAWDKLMPSKMVFTIRDPDKVMPNLKHEQVLSLFSATKRPAKNAWQFPSQQHAMDAIKKGQISLSDEISFPGMEELENPTPKPPQFPTP